ncbi:GumC family protein [Pelagovum pacificum]|nr:polysaccharide biosynthesis tyrosine autokinase [Pelagovum pacificum]QQA41927.1 polysaccharide biosynthesis tyrosine autokinase [Pelagovum pacificum]
MQNTPTNPADGREIIDLGALLAMVWRGFAVILFFGAVGFGLALTYAKGLTTPLFAATAELVLETRDEKIVDIEQVLGRISTDEEAILTEVHILAGRELAAQVVDELELADDVEFNGESPQSGLADFLASLRSRGETGTLPDPEVLREHAIETLRARTEVRNVPGTYAFSIEVLSADPSKAAEIANSYAMIYLENQRAELFRATEQASDWLAVRVADLAADVARAETAVTSLKSEASFADEAHLQGLERRLLRLRETLIERRAALEAKQRQLDILQEPDRLAAGAQVLVVSGLDRDQALAQVRSERAELSAQTAAIETSVGDLQRQILLQTEALTRLDSAQRDLESSRLLYENFRDRLRETAVQQGIHQPDSRIIEYAVAQRFPVVPNLPYSLGVGAVVGALIGGALTIGWQISVSRIRSSGQVATLTGAPVLAQMSRLPKDLDDLKPGTPAGEELRNLRTSLLLRRETAQVILVASAESGDGKTTISAALAKSFAEVGRRTLLVDCDLRRRQASAKYGRRGIMGGFADVILGRTSLDQSVIRSSMEGVDLLQAGGSGYAAADVLSRGNVADVLTQARGRWDTIILDTPPILAVPDARLLAGHVDSLLLVVRWNRTRRRTLATCLDRLRQSGHGPDAIVMSRMGGRHGVRGPYRQTIRRYAVA